MSVSQRPAATSIDVSGQPSQIVEAVVRMAAVCPRQFGADPSAEGLEVAEWQARESVNPLGCELLDASVEDRDDGASRTERDG